MHLDPKEGTVKLSKTEHGYLVNASSVIGSLAKLGDKEAESLRANLATLIARYQPEAK